MANLAFDGRCSFVRRVLLLKARLVYAHASVAA